MTPRQRELMERAYTIGDQLQQRKSTDPLREWKPTKAQKPFIDSALKEEAPESWFIAANRSGKSDAGAVIGATLARFGS